MIQPGEHVKFQTPSNQTHLTHLLFRFLSWHQKLSWGSSELGEFCGCAQVVNSIVLTFKTLDEYSQQLAKGAWSCCFFLGFVEFVATTFRLGESKRDNSCITWPNRLREDFGWRVLPEDSGRVSEGPASCEFTGLKSEAIELIWS